MNNVRILLVVSLAGILVACGNETGKGEAPPGSTITISPSAIEWAVEVSSNPPDVQRQAYVIHVSTAGGGDAQGANVQVFLDLASGTFSGTPFMLLMDKDGNPLTSPYETKTDSFGNINVLVDFVTGGGTTYVGNLQAFSGAAAGLSSITVTCVDSPSGTKCP